MAAVLKLLGRQMGLWELKRRLEDLGQRPGRCIEGNVAYGPCLLVSRLRGSLGGQVARLVGERLGWHVFDREIVDEIAKLAHVRQQLLESVDEQTRANWNNSWRPELGPEDIGSEHYLRCLREVVLTLGHHGDVVIVGRGSPFLLPAASSLRARFVAPLDLRVKRVADQEKVTMLEAQARVEKFDAERSQFVQKSFSRDPNSPMNYDLVINTGDITAEAAAEMVLIAMKSKLGVHPRRG
jgi:cytidylate kinase